MDTRRSFLEKMGFLTGGAALLPHMPSSIKKALEINPAAGTTFYDAEHIVFLMQENRSFDHAFGTLQGVRGFNDPRAITQPNGNKAWLQSNREGQTFAPFRLDIKDTKITWMGCLPHAWDNQVDAFNKGKFDKWLDVKHSGVDEFSGMPLTMGHYNRADIPFYYSLADAFTVCDQHFCSSLTGTTPNRLHFWTGTIRGKQEPNALANVWNSDADFGNEVEYTTYPERLEEAGVSWKVYQNDISAGVGFEGDEDGWLGNFGDNPLEYFKQYNVKLSREYIAALPKRIAGLQKSIADIKTKLATPGLADTETTDLNKQLKSRERSLTTLTAETKIYTQQKYNALSSFQKNIHDKAFTNNRKDPDYHKLAPLAYKEGGKDRALEIPKGDVLHQFREDVKNGELPTVSWLVAPQYFSDHPDSPWFGAWYVSEAMDILTSNPEIWKKTIFILTYDENDGYYDHVPPFVAPAPQGKHEGKVTEGIDTSLEFVTHSQQSQEKYSRESAIGLGFRVPLVVASPWTRGGWVNSEVFDHTSSLQFLEKFLEKKTGKKIEETNINQWRRTVCGDLTSIFRPYKDEKIQKPRFVEKDKFIEQIHTAQYRDVPNNFRNLSPEEQVSINEHRNTSSLLPVQEKGIRSATALPYELYVDGNLDAGRNSLNIEFKAATDVFNAGAIGSPFFVYAVSPFENEKGRTWHYAVGAGKKLQDEWKVSAFENNYYHLRVHGPNGFYREFIGHGGEPQLEVHCRYERKSASAASLSGNVEIVLKNKGNRPLTVELRDVSYNSGMKTAVLAAGAESSQVLNLSRNYNWYDVAVTVKGEKQFEKRFAGHVETGRESKTDPLMGGMV